MKFRVWGFELRIGLGLKLGIRVEIRVRARFGSHPRIHALPCVCTEVGAGV